MQKKVVVITGASSGIGKALAEKFAAEGFDLVLAARRIDRLEELQKKLSNVEVLPVKTDVTSIEDCQNLIDKAIEKFGKINILINNAGISMRASFEDLELDVLHKLMNVNYWGTVYCTKFALPHILKEKGSIVGVISTGGYIGLPGRTGYSGSKFAVRGFWILFGLNTCVRDYTCWLLLPDLLLLKYGKPRLQKTVVSRERHRVTKIK